MSSLNPTTNYSGTSALYNSALNDYDVKVGYYDATTGDNWAYFKLPTANQLPILGLTVSSASFNAYCDWSYYATTPEPTYLWENTSTNWSPTTVTWNTTPTHAASSLSSASVYRNQWAQFNITSMAQDWSNLLNAQPYTYSPDMGFFLNEAGNGQTYWHKYVAVENSTNQPYIQINYNAPTAPWGGLYTHSDGTSGYSNLWWNEVPNATSYNVLIWNGSQYETFNVPAQKDDQNQQLLVQHWTSKGKGIWPTSAEIAAGGYLLHHNGTGAELAFDPSTVYHNAFVTNGGTDYSSYKNYWFRVTAQTSDGQITNSSNAFTPTMQTYIPEKGQASTMIPLFMGAVNGATGNFVFSDTDLTTTGYGSQVAVTRTYSDSQRGVTGPLGNGWTLGYQTQVVIQNNLPHLIAPDGEESVFWPQPDGSYLSPPGYASWTLKATKDANNNITGFQLLTDQYTTEDFSPNGNNTYVLTDIYDKNMNHFVLSYTSGQLTGLTDASGRTTTIHYNANGTISSITDSAGAAWGYGYDASNNLVSVTDPLGNVTQYGYTNGDLTSVVTPKNNTYTISYNTNHQVTGDTDPGQHTESVSYGTGTVTYTDPSGYQTVLTYNNDHLTTQTTLDPTGLNRVSQYTYNEFNEVTQATDPKNNVTKYGYDNFGQLSSQTDPLNNTTTITRVGSSYGAVDHEVASVQTPQGGKYQFKSHDQTTALSPQNQMTGAAYNTNGTPLQGTYPISTANNPLENNSFESWITSNQPPTNWTESGVTHMDASSTDSKFGGQSWSVSGSATGSVYLYPSNSLIPISSLPSDSDGISFEVYAKASSLAAANSTRVQVNYFNSSGNYIGEADGTALPVTGQWYKLTVVAKKSDFPTGTVSIRPLINTDPTSTDTVKFDAADLVGYALAPQYNAIVNGDFTDPSSSLHDWSTVGTITVVPNSSTSTGTNTSSSAIFGPYSNVAQITPSTSWSGIKPSDSNQYIPYVSSQTYTLGGMIKGLDATNTYVALKYYDANKNYLNEIQSPVYSGTFGWQYVSVTLPANATVPSGTAYVMPEVLVAPTITSTPADAKSWMTEMRLSLDPNTSKYGYDTTGNYMTSATDPLGHTTQYTNDNEGNVKSVTDPLGNSLGMTYDANNQLKTQTSTSANLQVQYQYDGDGNVTQVKQTSSDGLTTYATQTNQPNNLDQVQSSTDSLGHTATYGYDANGRLNLVTLPDTHQVGSLYNAAGDKTSVTVDGTTVNQYLYDANSNVTSQSNANSTTTFGYDGNDNLQSQTDNVGSQSFTYDKNNTLTMIAATIGSTTLKAIYGLNPNEQVSSVTDAAGNSLAKYTYTEQGSVDTVALGNGFKASYRYDGNQRMQALTIAKGSTVVANYVYGYDNGGNLVQVTDQVTGGITQYQYDSLNRLTQEQWPDKTTVQYTYDPLGNIQQKNVGGIATSYSYNAGNELTAVNGQAYTYDANGNLTNDGNNTYKWNELGQLTEVDNSSGTPIAIYAYDALGRRVSEQAGGTTTKFFYQGTSNLVTYEADGSGNLLKSYAYSSVGLPLTMTTWSGGIGTTYYYHENGRGDVVALTDASGTTVGQYSYDAWGNILTSTGSMASVNPYRYAGYRFDSAVWMYYLNARYYKPDIMRFISEDPIDGTNLYVYADDNPVNKVDPDGEFAGAVAVFFIPGVGEAAAVVAAAVATAWVVHWGYQRLSYHYSNVSRNYSYAQNKKTAKKSIDSQEEHINKHEEKIRNNPHSRDVPHWETEVKAAKDKINKLKQRWNIK